MLVAASNPIANNRLNDLLIDVGRSLLQYTSECWPWAAAGEEETQKTLERMAAEQRDVVRALVDLLASRSHSIEFGAYPTEYTSLHYVAVDYLLSQLTANQQAVLAECEFAAAAPGDDEAKSLLDDVVLSERRHLDELRALESQRQFASKYNDGRRPIR